MADSWSPQFKQVALSPGWIADECSQGFVDVCFF